MEKTFGELMVFVFGVWCVVYSLSGRPIYRKGTGAPDPHQARIRLAMFGLGVAFLLLWFSEKYSN